MKMHTSSVLFEGLHLFLKCLAIGTNENNYMSFTGNIGNINLRDTLFFTVSIKMLFAFITGHLTFY